MKKFYKTPGQVCEGTVLCPSSATPALKNGKTERADQSRPLDAGSNACVRPSRSSQFLCCLCVLLLASVGCATPHRSTLTEHTVEKFANRPDGLIARETWRDKDSGGAMFLFTDPSSQGMCIKHVNQTNLGGQTWMMMAPFSSTVDSNLVPFVKASGDALGTIGADAVKAAK